MFRNAKNGDTTWMWETMVDASYIECGWSSAQLDEETSKYASLAQQNSFGQEFCGGW